MKNTEISVLVNLTDQLNKVVHTEGPFSLVFEQTFESLKLEYERISSVRPSAPSISSQANGLTRGDPVVFREIPLDPREA